MQSILVFQRTIENAHTVAHGLFKQGKQSEQLAGVKPLAACRSSGNAIMGIILQYTADKCEIDKNFNRLLHFFKNISHHSSDSENVG